MNVVILAAGMGRRMGVLTKEQPKCFLKINGITLIERLISQLRSIGLNDISIVTGYKSELFKFKNINLFYNKEYESTNMFYSLMKAKTKLIDDILIVYSDIILSERILKKITSKKYNNKIAVAVDINWKRYWSYRFGNINQDLESLKLNKKNEILDIGEKVFSSNNIDGRFIGVIRFPKKINNILLNTWRNTVNRNKMNWGISGNTANKAYMTDLINKLINMKIKCHAILFKNGWYEFDNKNDYYRFKKYKYLNN